MNISRISVSRMNVFRECKQRYKYQYHLKVPSPEPEPFHFVYGTMVHTIAEQYVIAKGEKKLEEIVKLVLNKEIPIEQDKEGNDVFAPVLPPDYKKRLPEHLMSIKKLTKQIGFEGDTEWKFEYDLEPPNNRMVLGFIDRLIRKGDKFFIFDYKTTKKGGWRKDSNSIKHDPQLRTYSRIIQKTFNVPAENIQAALYYLEGGNLIGARYTENQLEETEKLLLDCYKEIEEADPEKVWGRVGHHCKRCDYRSLCPFIKAASNQPILEL